MMFNVNEKYSELKFVAGYIFTFDPFGLNIVTFFP